MPAIAVQPWMNYAPSGGLVAAPTAGLPEQVGGERNRDYRYTWVHDASSVQALLRLGFVEEATQFSTWLAGHWDQPEEGIWETRGGRRDFTYGRVMNWVAFDRGLRLAAAHGRPASVDAWARARDAVYEGVMERGLEPAAPRVRAALRGRGPRLVAAAHGQGRVRQPLDPLWVTTLDAMDDELVTDSLV